MEVGMKSPGHQSMPAHKVEERPVAGKVEVEIGGNVIATSGDVVRVNEDDNPSRLYFPRSAVAMDLLERSNTTTQCPFKGTAHYFNLRVDGLRLPDAVWSYEEPYDEHLALKDRLAFYDDKFREIHVRATSA
jgi:uncharacterized protein (DUF427 family)